MDQYIVKSNLYLTANECTDFLSSLIGSEFRPGEIIEKIDDIQIVEFHPESTLVKLHGGRYQVVAKVSVRRPKSKEKKT